MAIASCAKEPAVREPAPQGEGTPIEVKMSFRTKAGSAAPTVNSIRLTAFDGNSCCVFNEKLSSSDFTVNEVTDGYEIEFNDGYFTLGDSDRFEVYAILNEDGFMLYGTGSALSDLLDENIEVGKRCIGLYQSYFNSPATYTAIAVSGTEPVFLMGAVASVTVEEGASKEPQTATFTPLQRSLAQVTVGGISCDDTDEAMCVVILGASLENIPSAMAWSTGRGVIGESPYSITLADKGSDSFMARDTDGQIAATVEKTSSTTELCYATSSGNGPNAVRGWTFDHTRAYAGNINDDIKKAKPDASALASELEAIFADQSKNHTESYTYTSFSESTSPVNTEWEIPLNASYYIPESVASETSDAVCIHVRAAIAGATPYSATDAGALANAIGEMSSPVYYFYNQTLSYWGNNNNGWKDYVSQLACNAHGGTVNHGVVGGETYKFSKVESGTASFTTCYVNDSKVVLTEPEHIYDFYIPVNNKAFDSDYSVRRNTKYTVNLSVTSDTYDALSTKACADAPFSIVATVESEKMNEYED